MNIETYILLGGSAGLILIGFLYYLYQISKGKKQSSNIEQYEEIRNKLTLKDAEGDIKQNIAKAGGKVEEDDEEETSYEGGGGFSLGSIIGGFVALLIGISLIGPITSEVKNAQAVVNMSGQSSALAETMLNLLPPFFAISILGVGIAVIYSSLRTGGMI